MKKLSALLCLVFAVSVLWLRSPVVADESNARTAADCDSTTLRLYFDPEFAMKSPQGAQSSWRLKAARLFVDDLFVGNAILNLHGDPPLLNLGAGEHTIRVELAGAKPFESKIHLLGRGSSQILFVDFQPISPAAKSGK